MTYKINGTELIYQPTQARWISRRVLGEDGNGRPIYSSVREYEMRWQLVDPSHVNQLQSFFDGVGPTGTAVVSLPEYNAPTYQFFDYSGTVIREPEVNHFFAEHRTEVILLITKIRT